MKKLSLAALAVFSLLISAGCSKLSNVSKLSSDGGINRTVTLSVMEQPGEEGSAPTDLKKLITFANASEWNVSISKKDQDNVLTAVRNLPAGSSRASDFTLEVGPGMKVIVSSKATKVNDSQIDYEETWKWSGKMKDDSGPGKEMLPELKKQLAEFNPTDAQVEKGMIRMRNSLYRAIFGPGEPMMTQFFSNPEGATRKLHVIMAKELLSFMKDEFPNTTESQRIAAARNIAKKISDDTSKQTTVNPENPPKEENSNMTAVYVAVEGPGDMISSNGEYDVIDNIVFWQLYSDACMYEPVVLKASFKVK